MKLSYSMQKDAQDRADKIYADLQAAGKLEPLTVRWDIPQLNADTGLWEITVDDRCRPVLTDAEVALVPEWAT